MGPKKVVTTLKSPGWDRSKGRPEPIAALNRVLETDNGEPLVDLREFAPSLKILRKAVIPYVRHTVAKMVENAASSLPDGVYLGVVDAWRPIERQQRIYEFIWKCAEEAFPGRSRASMRRTVCRFVAPTDQKAPPGHCTGAAVDVWLVDEQGENIDVSSPWERWQAAPTFVYGLSEQAQANRRLLHDTMVAAGFSNCRDEFWHYSFGDAGWAVRSGRSDCFYGLTRIDPEMYLEEEQYWLEDVKKRTNPFLPSLLP
jgi:D-alanyl-D-alanine dipeptidase